METNAALTQFLVRVAQEAHAAPRGQKEAVYTAALRQTSMSRATLLRKLKDVTVKPPRKRRSDAGSSALGLAQTQMLSAVLMEGYRANAKKIMSIPLALDRLRANDPGFACQTDEDTGELLPLSAGTCARALRSHCLHPEQLNRPAPSQPQASEHPNDVWQIDASISTLFYVPEDAPLEDMGRAEFYKNKPQNFERIKRQRLTRYCLTDHCSGAIFVHYVAGGESIANLTDSFLASIQQRNNLQMYGVPFRLVMDPGSGVTGAFQNLLRRLLVEPVINRVGNARAKGSVENSHQLVETSFESGFKLTHVPNIGWINEQAARWMLWYNSTRIHSRHGKTRFQKWMEITQEQLRLAPALELCRELLTHEPESRKVDQWLHVRFAGREWSVKDVPGAMVGAKLLVTYNPYVSDAAYVVTRDSAGMEHLHEVREALRDEHGFFESAARIGREHKSIGDTVLQTNRKAIERMAMGTDTDEAAAAARKAKTVPFGGAVDPFKHHDNVPSVAMLPRRGTELATTVSTTSTPLPVKLLTQFEAAQTLVAMGLELNSELVATLRSLHPDGVPEDQLEALQARLTVRTGLRVVAGGGA